MAERRESSVLFSLNELRGIEQDRVRTEEEAERARIEAERQAREEEIRRAREAEEAKRRAEEDRIRREHDERERIAREGELRLKESERRAQIEAAAKLEQARIEADARARIEGKQFPTGKVVGGIVSLVALAGIIMGYLVYQHGEEVKRIQAKAAAEQEAQRKADEARQRALEEKLAALGSQLTKATSEADKAKIREQMARERAAVAAASARPKSSSKSDKGGDKKVEIKGKSDDPLGGLGL